MSRQYFMVLADAELELIPRELVSERCVVNNARARGKAPDKILLDASHHHPAFGKLREFDRRGRPDLTHFFLMLCLDSDLSSAGRLRSFVHTRNDDVIAVNPETRLPPNYPRFVGLIETLYEKQVVPSAENALLELRHGVSLATLVSALKPDQVFILDPAGEKAGPLSDRFAEAEGDRVAVIVGGFSKGTFRSDVSKLGGSRHSLGDRPMKVWTVASKVLCALEQSETAVPPKPSAKPKGRKTARKADPEDGVKAPSRPRRARKKEA